MMWLTRFVLFVPGAVGFVLGLITAPLILGFRMDLLNIEFTQIFAQHSGRDTIHDSGIAKKTD